MIACASSSNCLNRVPDKRPPVRIFLGTEVGNEQLTRSEIGGSNQGTFGSSSSRKVWQCAIYAKSKKETSTFNERLAVSEKELGESTCTKTMNVHYKNCTPEDVERLKNFEPEVRKVVEEKGVAGDVCWAGDVFKGDTRDFRYFNLCSMTRPELYLATGYGEGFLRRVSREEFLDWLAHTPNTVY